MSFLRKCIVPVLSALVATATAAEWGTDYEAALAAAKQQGKAVLADFTGSDWCYYCIRLRKEVLDDPVFAAWAEKHFVLLEVDVPQHRQIDEKLLAQNQMLCTKYKIDGYPTVLVLDAKGRPLGGLFGYVGKTDIVRETLEPGLQADRLLRQAEQMQGEEKLRAMLAAWKLVPRDLHELNIPLQQELAAIDPQDLSGLKAAAAAENALQECIAAEAAAPTDAAAIAIVDAALEKAVPENRRQLLELKYRLMMRNVKTPQDVYAAAEVAYASIDADLRLSPAVKESRKNQLRGVYANPQTSINRSKVIYRRRPAK